MRTRRSPRKQEQLWRALGKGPTQPPSDVERLLTCLRNTTKALVGHVELEAKREGVPAAEACPCTTNEIAEANKLIDEIQRKLDERIRRT